ncbi:SAG family member [Cyclospora cayetanensis]|uniref:SAG family member n=1 Tax=Cyclospora cayetanensis TaxID=88456 RepID=A0A1D3CRC9_9EIME|nr:SAG family member [Cyclospora cayetanensis]
MSVLVACLLLLVAAVSAEEEGSVEIGLQQCVDAMNILRRSHLRHQNPRLTVSSQLETAAKGMLDAAFGTKHDCRTLRAPDLGQAPADIVGLVFVGDNPPCLQSMIQATHKLLDISPSFPPAYDEQVTPWQNLEAQITARFLLETATSVGCAYTKGCSVGYIVCKLSAMPITGQHPFSQAFYEALMERRASGIDLYSLGQDDIDTPFTGDALSACSSVWLTWVLAVASALALRH